MALPELAAAMVLAAVSATASPAPAFTLQDPALTEASGLAVSGRHPGIVWTHNDGGAVAQLRALDRDGRMVAVVTLAGVDPYDPEALAPFTPSGGKPELWLGDIGDNSTRRSDISVFRIEEPQRLVDQTVHSVQYRLRYPDGPHDAEAVMVQPRTGRVFVATKVLGTGGLYATPGPPAAGGTTELERVGDAPVLVTDGAFLPDGRMVLRTYSAVYLLDRRLRQVAAAELPAQPQGESVAVDGDGLLVGSEGAGSAVYRVPVPAPAAASPGPGTPSPGVSPERPRTPAAQRAQLDRFANLALVAAVMLALITVTRRWARRRRQRLFADE